MLILRFQFTVVKYIGIVVRLQISIILLPNDLESKHNDINHYKKSVCLFAFEYESGKLPYC